MPVKKRSILWQWVTARAPRTWIAHGLVSLGGATAAGVVGAVLWEAGPLAHAIGATVMLGYFFAKEMSDELKHQATGQWRKPKWQGVTPEVDQVGDLVGPVFVFATGWVTVLLQIL